ncbi:hypothetical protein RhiirA4_419005 [Rhizophagus irregularis]|uniref:Uncharacterized protein n=1 Tax=Rhizophagus irregularis TaxID=588596 RepID=A0A2I1GCQ6_9GLOM|nr:hypothetical protein RhiirA4_419005 [Rhizophagus irregularis]
MTNPQILSENYKKILTILNNITKNEDNTPLIDYPVLIGSRAVKWHISFCREPNDWDMVATPLQTTLFINKVKESGATFKNMKLIHYPGGGLKLVGEYIDQLTDKKLISFDIELVSEKVDLRNMKSNMNESDEDESDEDDNISKDNSEISNDSEDFEYSEDNMEDDDMQDDDEINKIEFERDSFDVDFSFKDPLKIHPNYASYERKFSKLTSKHTFVLGINANTATGGSWEGGDIWAPIDIKVRSADYVASLLEIPELTGDLLFKYVLDCLKPILTNNGDTPLKHWINKLKERTRLVINEIIIK